MSTDFDRGIQQACEPFGLDHDRLREELMASLPAETPEAHRPATGTGRRLWTGTFNMTRRVIPIGIPAAAAAALVLVVFMNQAGKPAYALAQTVEASKLVRSVHWAQVSYSQDPAVTPFTEEFWMEFDVNGRLSRFRKDSADSQKRSSAVWEGEIYKLWSPSRNKFSVRYAANLGDHVRADEDVHDPRTAATTLERLAAEQKLHVEISSAAGQDIQLTVTPAVPKNELPLWWNGDKYVILVDANTKLWKQRDLYNIRDGREWHSDRWSWLQYNETFDPSLFVLTPAAGAEIDDNTGDMGTSPGVRGKMIAQAFEHPEIVQEAARELLQLIRGADSGAGGGGGGNPSGLVRGADSGGGCGGTGGGGGANSSGSDRQQFPLHGRYTTHTNWPGLAAWICKHFGQNPIETIEIGNVSAGENGLPSVHYKLTLRNGSVLEDDVLMDYDPNKKEWFGMYGFDWHLKHPSGPPEPVH